MILTLRRLTLIRLRRVARALWCVPILGPRARRLGLMMKLVPQLRRGKDVGLLFGSAGFRTFAAGFSHARFVQFTDLAHSVHMRILDILRQQDVPFVVFAGHLVGYQRDGQIPLWAEDVDIMIFPEAFERFERCAIPELARAGFQVVPTTLWQPKEPFGGYAILGFAGVESSHVELRMHDDVYVKVPRAQVDVFFSRVDENGLVRNVGNWGPHQKVDLPVDVVLPAGEMEIHGRRLPTYRDPYRGVQIEYGDVTRFVHVFSHFAEHRHLAFRTPSWSAFRERLDRVIAETTVLQLPGGPVAPFTLHSTGVAYHTQGSESLEDLVRCLGTGAFDTVVLSGDLLLWVLDLKYWFPGLRVLSHVASKEDQALTLQLEHLLDGISERCSE